jgi:ATP-dependent HslUV protease subunit HslV
MLRSTTIIGVRRNGKVAIGGDGQVSLSETIMKKTANKVRKLHNGRVLAGFAGSAADAFTLYEKFEAKLEQYKGNLSRAAVELAKEWRSDRILRRLDALLAVLDKEHCYVISGQGEVVEPDDNIVAIGSGGDFALAAARALFRFSDLSAREIVEESIRIAASICVYTNENITVVEL